VSVSGLFKRKPTAPAKERTLAEAVGPIAERVAEEARLLDPARPTRRARLIARGILCGILVGYGLLAHRLHGLQIVDHAKWHEAAERQHTRLRPEPAERGRLLLQDDGRLVPGAVSLVRGSLLVEGRADRDAAKFMARLDAALGTEDALTREERSFVEERLKRSASFYLRRRRLDQDVMARLRAARLGHSTIEVEPIRAYPFGGLGAQLLGLVGAEGKGAAGLEARLDEALTGQAGQREVRLDNLRRELVAPGSLAVPATPGLDAVLTIDRGIQAVCDAELAACAAEHEPLGAAAVVVDPQTGDILAMASWPTFDPSDLRGDFSQALRCRAITDTYEPGSTIKPLFIGTAWELGLGGPDRPIHCPKVLHVPGRKKGIEDHHLVGSVFEADVLVQSSNSGAYQITARLTPEQRKRVGEAFGLGRRSGIALPGEAPGRADALSRTDVTTLGSFAQGYAVSVTPLQMAMVYGALANGGTLYRPRLVRELRTRDGQVAKAFDAEPVSRPLSGPMVRGELRAALERVVSDPRGTAKRAACARYSVAGKTGTTKLLVDGKYHEREVVASFCGFAPAEAPRLAFSVVVWGPSTKKQKAWGGTVAAPVAGRIAEQALTLLRVPPRSPVVEEEAKTKK
jgi:cell division protein FtsI/penicillin-binding protein 2